MAEPVAPAAGLVAGYGFDARSGRTAVDISGNGNTGEIIGAAWAPGRYVDALRFDGETAVVRVPASSSLNLGKAMTLSGGSSRGAAGRLADDRPATGRRVHPGGEQRRPEPLGAIDVLRMRW